MNIGEKEAIPREGYLLFEKLCATRAETVGGFYL